MKRAVTISQHPVARSLGYYWRRPRELGDRVASEWERWREPLQPAAPLQQADVEAVDAFHQLMDSDRHCEACEGFDGAWEAIASRVDGVNHHDSGSNTLRALWAAVRHLQPDRVVETGVARGFSSATILAALAANGKGHLWSIDLPEVAMVRAGSSGVAVPPELTPGWTWLRGGSRRLLPTLLHDVEPIDLFVHDSLHTKKNMLFEMDQAWQALRPGGVLFVDDIDVNTSFSEFVGTVGARHILRERGDAPGAFGAMRKPG